MIDIAEILYAKCCLFLSDYWNAGSNSTNDNCGLVTPSKEKRSMLEVSALMPEEWLHGYFSRLAVQNSCLDIPQLNKLIAPLPPHDSPESIPKIAKLLDRPVQDLIQQHTLFPAKHAIYFKTYSEAHQVKISMRKMQKPVKFCHQCIEEDWEYVGQGFPYLRRIHQVTGIDWCLKHKCRLGFSSLDDIPGPGQFGLLHEQSIIQEPLESQHEIIQKYVEIFEGLISNSLTLSADHVSLVLEQQAKKAGFNTSPAKSARCISDVLVEEISSDWLLRNFPTLKAKVTNKALKTIDGAAVFRLQNHNVTNYVLAAAVLFDSADEALMTLNNSSNMELKPRRALIKRNAEFWRGNDLRQIYIKNLGTGKAIADDIGGDYDQVRQNLIKYGLPPLTNLSLETIKALADFYKGATLAEILSRPGVNREHFEQVVRSAGNQFGEILNQIKEALMQKSTERLNRINSKDRPH
ncbi:MAG: TniQ family protein [Methylophilus sp.]|uniref:TniQ family protein n=1 Tax=Methylophilus sp. TaxID=29541 RepID=UPI003F9F5EB0